MNNKKQKVLLELLISSPDTFALCNNIVEPSYFNPELRNCVEFIKEYYEQHHTTPPPMLIEAESGVELELYDVTEDNIHYCAVQVEEFCKKGAMSHAVLQAAKHVNEGNYPDCLPLIQAAMEVSLNQDLGLRYFDTVEERLARMQQDNPTMATGWSNIDDALFGGISRKELLLVSANSGGGKSITLGNLATHFIEGGRDVLYLTLELSEDVVAQRFDTMFTGIGRRDWKCHVSEITTRLEVEGNKEGTGILDIKYMPQGTNANAIRAYLKEYYLKYKKYPDLLCLDYLDEMSPIETVSADNVFEKDKRTSSQLRQIGVDFNMAVATASQLNRSAVGATEHNHSQIAGGISKIHLADVYWSIIMTDIMKAQGECVFVIQKTRNSDGVGRVVQLEWDSKYLRIRDRGIRPSSMKRGNSIPSTVNTDLDSPITSGAGNGLVDLMHDI
jgi:hypothetical protein